jgi:hypothetical protein
MASCLIMRIRSSFAPEVFEPIGRQLGVAYRMLNVLVSKVGLQCPGIMPLVVQSESTGVAQHVWVSLEAKPGSRTHRPLGPELELRLCARRRRIAYCRCKRLLNRASASATGCIHRPN